MYKAIEAGVKWPDQVLIGRTAWLDKTEGAQCSLDPLDYRGLAILSNIYRLYFAIRLGDIRPWIATWEDPELYAGTTAATGAEDAWYFTALDFELAKLLGEDITGGSADIWKCFDQIQRQLVYFLLEAGGFPKGILTAYRSFHENVMYHNTVGSGLGAPHFKQCSIPQGCPLSMTIIAYLFHPWVKLMKAHGAKPRGLADDLTITATGTNHEAIFKNAFDATFYYLKDLGAKPAPKKCFTFSTAADTRFKLQMHCWESLDTSLNVVNDTRDLGGHLSTQSRLTGSTLTKRMQRACSIATKIGSMPWTYDAKQKVVETLVYPLGLYGCEASPLAEREAAKLSISVAKAVAPYSQHSSNNLAFIIAKKGKDFSTTGATLQRSFAMLRRMIAKHPEARKTIERIFGIYLGGKKQGTIDYHDEPLAKPHCPPQGSGNRAPWKDNKFTHGPIGLLLNRVHECGAYLNPSLQLLMYPTIQFDPINCAMQHLKRHVADVVARSLSASISDARSAFTQCRSTDLIKYHNAISQHSRGDAIKLKRLRRLRLARALW